MQTFAINCMRHAGRPLDNRPADRQLCNDDIENARMRLNDEIVERSRKFWKACSEERLG